MEKVYDNVIDGYAEGEEPVNFYYNRKRRLENAPDIVKDYYENGLNRPRGFFGVLFNRKGNKFLFISMVACFAIVGILNFAGPKKNEGRIGPLEFVLQSFSFEDNIYSSLKISKYSKKTVLNKQTDISCVFRFYDRDGTCIFEDRVGTVVTESELSKNSLKSKNGENEKFLRTTYKDYDIMKVECFVSDGKENILLLSGILKR